MGCKVFRRKEVTSRKVIFGTGKEVEGSKKVYWVEEDCGTPLFSHKERRTGVCNSCDKGWKVDTNFPLDTPQNRRLVPHYYEALADG